VIQLEIPCKTILDAFGVALYRLGLSCSQYAQQGADSVEQVGRSMEQLNIEISRGWILM